MKRLLIAFLFSLFFVVAWVSPATADEAASGVYVVEVRGDGLDATRVRAGVARELSATAVAPGDPRAASAAGRILVEAQKEPRTLRVTFEKVGSPVTRAIELPPDAAKAESAAVFLAGNLARDEAGDLLAGMKKPSAPPDPQTPPVTPQVEPSADEKRDLEDLSRMRLILRDGHERARGRRTFGLVTGSIVGPALLAPGIYLVAENRSEGSTNLGVALTSAGGTMLVVSLVSLVVVDPEESLHRKLTEIERESSTPGEVILRMETEWQAQAAKAKRARRDFAILGLVIGGLTLAGGVTLALARSTDDSLVISTLLMASGSVQIGAYVAAMLLPGDVERSYRQWQIVRGPKAQPLAAQSPRPSVGFAPLPGGAAISAAFSF